MAYFTLLQRLVDHDGILAFLKVVPLLRVDLSLSMGEDLAQDLIDGIVHALEVVNQAVGYTLYREETSLYLSVKSDPVSKFVWAKLIFLTEFLF